MIKCQECRAILNAKSRKYADGTQWVHQNEDKSIDVNLEFNGNFEDKVIE